MAAQEGSPPRGGSGAPLQASGSCATAAEGQGMPPGRVGGAGWGVELQPIMEEGSSSPLVQVLWDNAALRD